GGSARGRAPPAATPLSRWRSIKWRCARSNGCSPPPIWMRPGRAAWCGRRAWRCFMPRCCAPGSRTRTPAKPAPWRRSTASLPAAPAMARSSTTFAGSRRSSRAWFQAEGAGAETPSPRPPPEKNRSRCESRARSPTRGHLDRHPDRGPQAAKRAAAEPDVAAVGARDVAGNGEPEAGAALVLIARIVEPQERLEHFLAHAGRNARTVVIDRHGEPAVIAMTGDRDRVRESRRVGYEVGETAAERGRTHADHRPGRGSGAR